MWRDVCIVVSAAGALGLRSIKQFRFMASFALKYRALIAYESGRNIIRACGYTITKLFCVKRRLICLQ
jgi:hypothetical protein